MHLTLDQYLSYLLQPTQHHLVSLHTLMTFILDVPFFRKSPSPRPVICVGCGLGTRGNKCAVQNSTRVRYDVDLASSWFQIYYIIEAV